MTVIDKHTHTHTHTHTFYFLTLRTHGIHQQKDGQKPNVHVVFITFQLNISLLFFIIILDLELPCYQCCKLINRPT